MSDQCIHGFPTQQCMSCRTCPHGQVTSSCAKCRTPVPTRKANVVAAPVPPSEEHAGYEVYYEPEVSGWRYRDADSAPSQLSYRSAFLARKAIDELGTKSDAKPSAKSKGAKAAR
jgi:hypothetical protein